MFFSSICGANSTRYLFVGVNVFVGLRACVSFPIYDATYTCTDRTSIIIITDGLPLLFGVPFIIVISNIVIFIMWTFSANKHMGGWMDRWICRFVKQNLMVVCRHLL